MKNFMFLVFSFFLVGILFTSCNNDVKEIDNFIIEDELEGFKPMPINDDVKLEITVPEELQAVSPLSEVVEDGSRSNCDNYIAVTDIFLGDPCGEWAGTLYCEYLVSYYIGLALIYEYDCNRDVFCASCRAGENSNIQFMKDEQERLRELGVHEAYINDLNKIIERLELLCSQC